MSQDTMATMASTVRSRDDAAAQGLQEFLELYNDLARVYSGLNPEVQASIRERAIERADAVPVAMDDWIQIFKLGLVQFIQEERTPQFSSAYTHQPPSSPEPSSSTDAGDDSTLVGSDGSNSSSSTRVSIESTQFTSDSDVSSGGGYHSVVGRLEPELGMRRGRLRGVWGRRQD